MSCSLPLTQQDNGVNQWVDPLVTGGFDLDAEMISPNPCDEDVYCSGEMAMNILMSSITMWSDRVSSRTRKSA